MELTLTREMINAANRRKTCASCPSCHHFNAMLLYKVHNYETNDVVLKCRDCGFLVVIAHADMPDFC